MTLNCPPFPEEWVDPNHAHAVQSTVQEMYEHAKDYLDTAVENPIEDAPFDMDDDWGAIRSQKIDSMFLWVLVDENGNGLAFKPTGTFLLIARSFATNMEEFFESVEQICNKGTDGTYIPDAEKVPLWLGTQMCKAHTQEVARILMAYIMIQCKASQGDISAADPNAIAHKDNHGVYTFHLERFTYASVIGKTNRYRLSTLATDIDQAATNIADSIVNARANLRTGVRTSAEANTPKHRYGGGSI